MGTGKQGQLGRINQRKTERGSHRVARGQYVCNMHTRTFADDVSQHVPFVHTLTACVCLSLCVLCCAFYLTVIIYDGQQHCSPTVFHSAPPFCYRLSSSYSHVVAYCPDTPLTLSAYCSLSVLPVIFCFARYSYLLSFSPVPPFSLAFTLLLYSLANYHSLSHYFSFSLPFRLEPRQKKFRPSELLSAFSRASCFHSASRHAVSQRCVMVFCQ